MKKVKVAITGGPSGGKTTLIEAVKKELGREISVVPEAASILYRGGFPRGKTNTSRIHTQKAIYYTQKEIENLTWEESDAPLMVCDRGSLDSIAYWPMDESHFFSAVASSRKAELDRYDWLIHLDTAGRDFYDSSNPIRTESHDEAVQLNEKIKQAWKGHPQRIIIAEYDDFLGKMARSLAVITAILDGKKYESILKEYGFERAP